MAVGIEERNVTTDNRRVAASTPSTEYNFDHFRFRHVIADAKGTITGRGIRPGALAPDFELPRTNGGSLRLSELRDQPVLLHFGSFT